MDDQTPPSPAHELLLLSPFRLPTQSSLYLANEDVCCFLNGHAVLWHPALLLSAGSLPRIDSPYDHEQPVQGRVYVIPEHPPLVLPDDWTDRVKAAGAVTFRAPLDRTATLANLREVLPSFLEGHPQAADALRLLDLPPELIAPFFGLGFGHAHLVALCEAMNHDNLLDVEGLFNDVKQAIQALLNGPDVETCRKHLEAAAQRLLTAREVLYPVTIHLIDLVLLNAQTIQDGLPASLHKGVPANVVASGLMLEALGNAKPDMLDLLKRRASEGTAEICGGCYVEREDALLPIESQLWNLTTGMAMTEEIIGTPVRVHARQRYAYHPHLPTLLQAAGLTRTLFLSFDESSLPPHRSVVVNWSATDGKSVDAFCRAPHGADSPQTFFHVAHYLHETIRDDHVATVAILHSQKAEPFYDDWLELSKLAPVLGTWTTLSHYFDEVSAGDYASPAGADDFHADHLTERWTNPEEEAAAYSYGQESKPKLSWATVESRRYPVSAFAAHARTRRRIDAAWTFAALHRSLAGKSDTLALADRLTQVEDQIELTAPASNRGSEVETTLNAVLQESAEALAARLQARAEENRPGYMVLNPCSFSRRVIVELKDVAGPAAIEGPVKACQMIEGVAHLVVEVPALGFAWFPKPGPGGRAMAARMKLADDRCVRNEFFEAEVDPHTGGLKRISDMRQRLPRLGQQLVYNPGSQIRVQRVTTTSTGPAFGEIVSEGALVNEHDEVLATFRQRFRAWLGRPVLDMRIELTPQQKPTGYPWHAYYGSRFAWRDERSLLLRGVHSLGYLTSQTRPESPDYLEMRAGRTNTILLMGGLPFHQRQGGRMVDVILVPAGEECQTFELAIGLDRDYPALTACGMVSPVTVVTTTKGPPHIGATGWLFHLDAPNVLLTSLRPALDGSDAIFARMTECGVHGSHAELRCVRNPARVQQMNLRGEVQSSPGTNEDLIFLDPAQGELIPLRIDFSVEEPPVEEASSPPPDFESPPM